MQHKKRIIIGITGASGPIFGIKLIKILKELDIESHLIISDAAKLTINYETSYSFEEVVEMADYNYENTDISSSVASGSFKTDGMIIAPCSINTMSNIACGNINTLIARAADVCLKERRKLVLMVRESPLHLGHLRNMTLLTEIGAIIAPPMPALYALPKSIDDLINHTIGKIINLFNIENNSVKSWQGIM